MPDIALSEAQVIWGTDDIDGAPPVKVVGGLVRDDNTYSSSWGACNQDFIEGTNGDRIRMLLTQSIHLTLNEGLAPADVHEAFMVIPEYRQALIAGGVMQPEGEAEY